MRKFLFVVFALCVATNAFSAVTCPSGFSENTVFSGSGTFASRGVFLGEIERCPDGYETFVAPDEFWFAFTGLVQESDIRPICENGTYVGGECVEYEQGKCPQSYDEYTAAAGTFTARGAFLGQIERCPDEYESYEAPNAFYPIFTGYVGTAAATCPDGQHMAGGTCVAYESGTCPTGYYDTGLSASFDSGSNGGACESGYSEWDTIDACDNDSDSALCTMFCGLGFTKLKTSTGLKYNVYNMKTTTPSLNIGTPESRCYINLESGRATDAVNMGSNDDVYHLTN